MALTQAEQELISELRVSVPRNDVSQEHMMRNIDQFERRLAELKATQEPKIEELRQTLAKVEARLGILEHQAASWDKWVTRTIAITAVVVSLTIGLLSIAANLVVNYYLKK